MLLYGNICFKPRVTGCTVEFLGRMSVMTEFLKIYFVYKPFTCNLGKGFSYVCTKYRHFVSWMANVSVGTYLINTMQKTAETRKV